MQRGVRFVILEVPFGVPCWVKSGRQKRYKTFVFLLIFNIMGAPGVDPICLDPVCLGSICLGPVCLDLVCLDPVCLGPVCLGPLGAVWRSFWGSADPVCLDSFCLDPVFLPPERSHAARRSSCNSSGSSEGVRNVIKQRRFPYFQNYAGQSGSGLSGSGLSGSGLSGSGLS